MLASHHFMILVLCGKKKRSSCQLFAGLGYMNIIICYGAWLQKPSGN